MKTTLKTPFEIRNGDGILNFRGEVLVVTESRNAPTSIGGCIEQREGTFVPQKGDRYFVMMADADGKESGISGKWDGDTFFRVVTA